MFCADCGKTIPEGAHFCQGCGARVSVEQAAPPAPATPPVSAPTYLLAPLPPRKRTHEGLIPGIITAAIILLAGLGVGLFFGLKDGSGSNAASTSAVTNLASSTTAAPATTAPPTTTVTSEPTASSEPPATAEQTTTTESAAAILAARVAGWENLLQSIPGSGPEIVTQVAAFLTPRDRAQERAVDIVESWSEAGDPDAIIESDPFDHIVNSTFGPDRSTAFVLNAYNLHCRDGLTTRGLETFTWQLDGGEWMLTADAAPAPVDGYLTPLGGAVRAGDLLWSPGMLHELKHLAAAGGPTATGMFMTVEFYVENTGSAALAPSSYQVSAVDGSGKHYAPSKTADKWWDLDVEERKTKIAAGDYIYLWYTFEIPEGADLQSFQYQVLLPAI